MLILYAYDINAILAEPIPSRSQDHLVEDFTKLHTYLHNKGHKVSKHILDNEAPPDLTSYFNSHNIEYQLVPPYVHRANASERAIKTFKHLNHPVKQGY